MVSLDVALTVQRCGRMYSEKERWGGTPCSYSQEMLIFNNELDPFNPAHNESFWVPMRGKLDVSALYAATRYLCERHTILMSRFALTVSTLLPANICTMSIDNTRSMMSTEHTLSILIYGIAACMHLMKHARLILAILATQQSNACCERPLACNSTQHAPKLTAQPLPENDYTPIIAMLLTSDHQKSEVTDWHAWHRVQQGPCCGSCGGRSLSCPSSTSA